MIVGVVKTIEDHRVPICAGVASRLGSPAKASSRASGLGGIAGWWSTRLLGPSAFIGSASATSGARRSSLAYRSSPAR
jgi:hypothetical protein